MAERLLVVEDAFLGGGRGVLVMPRFTAEGPAPPSLRVRLRLPDGRERETAASVQIAHMRGSLPPFAMYRLLDVAPADVPAGTEIWSIDG